ncbi:polysaccharide deacetylase family protein [Flavobacterium sp. LT1R49]|uniref:polysaccharide deacetylase family protein n=1 Tax=Flavobacterium arabinosi TaxID=3398737 RepID=UPI003A895873
MQSNTNKKKFKFILLCTFFLFSCQNKNTPQKSKPKEINPGVVISFDDASINEWFQADKILRQYSWKATFCVSKINTLNRSEIKKLLDLQKEGHEIAGHSLNHFDAPKFVAKNEIDAYIDQEINPMLAVMHFYSLKVTSFAYPFGFRNSAIDIALLKKFKIIRGTTYGAEDPFFQNCYFNHSKLVFAIGIDTDHPNFSVPYLIKLLDYAKRKHKILLLFGHKPVKKITANYQTKIETLQLICNYVKQHNMTFYSLSDLNNLK